MATIYYTATSLDGFIATPDDSVDWLDAMPQPDEDTYTPFFANVGAVAMGSATYEFLLRHIDGGGDWPYAVPSWVFTTRDLEAVPGADIRFARDIVAAHTEMVDAANGKDVWICGGGDLAGQFLDAGLLDELVITVAAHTLGDGKPLLPRNAKFDLVSARALGTGFAELRVRPA